MEGRHEGRSSPRDGLSKSREAGQSQTQLKTGISGKYRLIWFGCPPPQPGWHLHGECIVTLLAGENQRQYPWWGGEAASWASY